MTLQEIIGETPRARKLKFLVHYYREMQKQYTLEKNAEEFWRYELMINGFRNEYVTLTHKVLEEVPRQTDKGGNS